MENLRFREVKIFAYSHTASEGRAIFKGLSDSNDGALWYFEYFGVTSGCSALCWT